MSRGRLKLATHQC